MKAEEMRADYSVLNAPETIASGWHRVRLGDIAKVIRGVTYKKEQASENPARDTLPILRATNIQDGALVLDSDLVHVPADLISDTQKLRVGDIVVATSSGSKHLVGKTAQVKETWEGSFGAFCAAIRPTTDIYHRYLGYFFESREYKDYIVKKALGVNINNLRRGDLEEISVPVAPLDQQKHIVAEIEKQFSRLDDAVANLKRVKANLKRYKAAALKAAVEGRLVETEAELARREGRTYETGEQLLQRILETRRSQWQGKGKFKEPAAPDTTDLPELPEGWVWASVDQLAAPEPSSITDGPFGSNLKTEHYQDAGPRVIRLQNIKDGEFADEYAHITQEHFERLSKHEIRAGDLVIASLGENPPRACIIPASVGPAIVKADCIRFKPHPSMYAKYLNAALNCLPTRQRVKDVLHGIGRPRLSLGEIRSIALPVPPRPEQQRIIAEIDRRLSIIRETEIRVDANLQRAERMRQAILGRAFKVPQSQRAMETIA
ncbi:MAG: restriction endonuclease subunit S [Thiobacillus sp.]|uniref:restriction endonuclease subunit S n=1 Tax=Thiobacillus sp. TaxID=924 RepID=UPI0028942E74|nr:restriction endonuclease subunit S [Thiobacillus sp.]MDT3706098.1 restriction endonuclease subunit S [Thiobacillus sp.]